MNLILPFNHILVEQVAEDTDGIEVVEALGTSTHAKGRMVTGSTAHMNITPGDTVYFAKGAGEEITHEGTLYRVLYVSTDHDTEVLAISPAPSTKNAA